MKIILITAVLFGWQAYAQNPKPEQKSAIKPAMTNAEAKKACQGEGKTGTELIKCMKEKKEEK